MADALVALTIAGLFLTSLLTISQTSMTASGRSRDQLVAAYVARGVLEDPSVRDYTGTFVSGGKSFTWTKTVTERAPSEIDRVRLVDVGVTVEWDDSRGNARSIRVRTVRLRSLINAD